jgi:hypothetical protein
MSPSESVAGNGGREGVSRRDFLRVGGLGVISLSAAEQARRAAIARERAGERRCLLIVLEGGVSHLDTFDPKPQAPLEFRGPFRSIATNVPGLQVSEVFPRLARQANRFALVRSMHSRGAAIHEAGLQLTQAGETRSVRSAPLSFGAMASQYLGADAANPVQALLPGPVVTGDELVDSTVWEGLDHGAWTTGLGRDQLTEVELARDSDPLRLAYGESDFGRNCLRARQLLEQDFRFVTVRAAASSGSDATSGWDCHAFGTLAPWKVAETAPHARLCDQVLSTLFDDLAQRGLLSETLVVVTTEFGRTPRVNRHGGRDHWTRVWSALVAGGGVTGGAVIGASDARGCEPIDHPVTPANLGATILAHFTSAGAASEPTALPVIADASPIAGLMG